MSSRAGGISPRKPLRLRARSILCALATLGLMLTAAALLAPTPGSARDPRDPVTIGTGIKVQDPVRNLTSGDQSVFKKSKSKIFGAPAKKVDKTAPLYLQGDELIYDSANSRVIAVGNVEIVFNNYILTADRVVYDQAAQTLTAEGNAQLKEPNGNIVRAEKLTATDDFREAFVQSLSVTAKRRHPHHGPARHPPRRQRHRVRGRPLLAVPHRWQQPAALVHQRHQGRP